MSSPYRARKQQAPTVNVRPYRDAEALKKRTGRTLLILTYILGPMLALALNALYFWGQSLRH